MPRLLPLLLCAALAAADPDAWMAELRPPGDGWRATKQELVFNNESEPKTIDPHLMSGIVESRVALGLFEGLTVLDPRDLTPRPGLAASWEQSADGLAFTFHLRPGLVFSDGTPLTAATVRGSWLRAIDPATGADYAELFDPIVGAEARRTGTGPAEAVGIAAPDPLTFTVRLAKPCPWFLSLCAFQTFAALPLHSIGAHGERWTRPEHVVSSGAFVLAEWSPREHIVLTPNPRWRARAQVRLARITLLPYQDADAAYRLFREGGLHWMPSIPLAKWEEVRWLAEYYVAPFLTTYFYRFNCSKPPFDDKRVRRAFSQALDRSVVAGQVLKAGQIPATWLTPAMPGYDPPAGLPTDRAAARRLLAEAGWGPQRPLPPVELLYNTSEAHKQVAEAVARQWEDALGVRVQLVNREWKAYLADTNALNYQIARASWVGDYLDPDTFIALWRSGGGNNRTGWSSPAFDRGLAEAQLERDPQRRLARYRELERMLVEDEFPFMPIYIYVNQGLLRQEVRGWWENVRDEHPWWCMWLEP